MHRQGLRLSIVDPGTVHCFSPASVSCHCQCQCQCPRQRQCQCQCHCQACPALPCPSSPSSLDQIESMAHESPSVRLTSYYSVRTQHAFTHTLHTHIHTYALHPCLVFRTVPRHFQSILPFCYISSTTFFPLVPSTGREPSRPRSTGIFVSSPTPPLRLLRRHSDINLSSGLSSLPVTRRRHSSKRPGRHPAPSPHCDSLQSKRKRANPPTLPKRRLRQTCLVWLLLLARPHARCPGKLVGRSLSMRSD